MTATTTDKIGEYWDIWTAIMIKHGVAKRKDADTVTMFYQTGETWLCAAFAEFDECCPEGFAMLVERPCAETRMQ